MIEITPEIHLEDNEVVLTSMTAQGSGGQNVNKVASAIHLRFDIHASSLPEELKQRLLNSRDRRISRKGALIIKAQRSRHQERNRADALQRLVDLIQRNLETSAPRKATRPTRASKKKRLEQKTQRSQTKALRKKVEA
jgi:ribosome-associated protein